MLLTNFNLLIIFPSYNRIFVNHHRLGMWVAPVSFSIVSLWYNLVMNETCLVEDRSSQFYLEQLTIIMSISVLCFMFYIIFVIQRGFQCIMGYPFLVWKTWYDFRVGRPSQLLHCCDYHKQYNNDLRPISSWQRRWLKKPSHLATKGAGCIPLVICAN